MKNKILLSLILSGITAVALGQSGISGVNQWLDVQMQGQANTATSYLLLLLGGLLASLLPCTYPLYPITVNVIKNRSDHKSKLAHPVAYFAGIVVIYFAFGIIASVTGGAFNQVLRMPLANLTIGIIIFLMGLSSIELLMIPIFSGSSGNSSTKGLFGTFSMGMGAGLLASACVGPILVTILLSIASSSDSVSIQVALISAFKMLLFGIGLGIPFLLLGIAGASLPKAGKWMKWVQYVFALLILYFSYFFIEKALLGFNFTSEQSIIIFSASLIFVFSYYWFQQNNIMPHERMNKSLFLFACIVAILVLFSQFNKGANYKMETSVELNKTTEQANNLTWYLDKNEAYAEALKLNKNVFVDFHANWCTNCKAFQKLTQTDSSLNSALKESILLKVYDTSPLFKEYQSDTRFPELKIGLPFFIITNSKENILYKTNDYTQTESMVLFLETQ